jgi:hypothetical protein
MTKKIFQGADLTVGDVLAPITITTDLNISGYALTELEFIFIKPSGGTLIKNPSEITGTYSCKYNTVSDDLDEDGDWEVYLKDLRIGREFQKGNNSFKVRPKAQDMALYNG